MCSQMDDPTQHDKVTRPRVYELTQKPRGSIALAVIGEMLGESEYDLDNAITPHFKEIVGQRVVTLREARERIADAEQLSRVGYLR